jgi:hypothetical protein
MHAATISYPESAVAVIRLVASHSDTACVISNAGIRNGGTVIMISCTTLLDVFSDCQSRHNQGKPPAQCGFIVTLSFEP